MEQNKTKTFFVVNENEIRFKDIVFR